MPEPDSSRRSVEITVNGHLVRASVEPRRLLADFLRDDLGLTGTHLGCEHGVCGACTVLLDGRPVRSCLAFAVQAAGRTVETIEGLATAEGQHPLQTAFHEEHALQCGFCTPGFLLTLKYVLERDPTIDSDAIREAISGNLCRCTGYTNIVRAALRAGATMTARKD
ncbi:MAG TPA: (2Fe-2S)-binding protein [Candidatus Saccharimonadales bacterium]|nr:(2Fe-2S)-binding protein [Candidatus Saccharimonadales bacterium]